MEADSRHDYNHSWLSMNWPMASTLWESSHEPLRENSQLQPGKHTSRTQSLKKNCLSPAKDRTKKSAEEMLRVEESDHLDLQNSPFKFLRKGSWDDSHGVLVTDQLINQNGLLRHLRVQEGKQSSCYWHEPNGWSSADSSEAVERQWSLFWSQKSAVIIVMSWISFQPSPSIIPWHLLYLWHEAKDPLKFRSDIWSEVKYTGKVSYVFFQYLMHFSRGINISRFNLLSRHSPQAPLLGLPVAFPAI